MPPPSRTTAVLVVAGAVVLVVAVLARPSTATDEESLADVRESLAATPSVVAAPEPDEPLPSGRLVVRPEGVDGLRLGTAVADLVAAGWSVQPRPVAGCRRVLPGLADAGPGEGVAGWVVGDRLAAVTVDARAGEGSSFLGPGVGDRLSDLPDGDGMLRADTRVEVPWQDEPLAVEVAWLRPAPSVRASFADLDTDGRIDHVQVLDDAAAGCAPAERAEQAEQERALPALDLGGRGALRVGMTLTEAAATVRLVDPAPGDPGSGATAPPCRLVLADDEPGLLYLVVSADASGTEVVRAVTVDAGATDTGLRVGDPPEAVGDAYPGITTAYLADRWGQGLSADWQVDGGVLRLWPGREEVRVPEVDAVVEGPREVVGLLQVGPGC